MQYHPQDHTFAICAYQESEFLEECILSLKAQTVSSRIILCTSTPNDLIEGMAARYKLDLFVSPVSEGIASDWNFAFASAGTELVTLAHQDDVYEPDYLEQMLQALDRSDDPMICFSDYYEIREGKRVDASLHLNLRIKHLMLLPLRSRALQRSVWVRRRILSFGNPIGCPSVLYVRSGLPETIFQEGFASNVDWQTWETLSKRKGDFVYIHKDLMGHRIHPGATTAKLINASGVRAAEDFAMFCRFWPAPIAGLICRFYVKSQKSKPKEGKASPVCGADLGK